MLNIFLTIITASQLWCLSRYLPILIGDKVEEDNPYWENYLCHATLMDEIFAPVTNDDRAEYVALLIEDYLSDFVHLYPERRLTPKMHYLVHIPTWMKWY